MILLIPLFFIVFILLLALKLVGGPIDWFWVYFMLGLFVVSLLSIFLIGVGKKR